MNYYQNNSQPYMGGMNMTPQQNTINGNMLPKRSNYITPESIANLRSKAPDFTLAITQEDSERGACNHFDINGNMAATEIPGKPGYYKCSICGYEFLPEENLAIDEVNDIVRRIINVLQTIKLMYVDMPANAGKEFFQIIPLLEKVPQLYKIASENSMKYENGNTFGGYSNGFNPFQMFAAISNPGQMYQQTPVYGGYQQPPMQGGYQQQPVYGGYQPQAMQGYNQPNFQQQAMTGGNPFGNMGGAQAPMNPPQQQFNNTQPNGYTPQTSGYAYTPGQPQPVPQQQPQQQPQADNTVKVNAQMKS